MEVQSEIHGSIWNAFMRHVLCVALKLEDKFLERYFTNDMLAAKSLAEANASQVQEVKCDFCHGPNANGMCSPEAEEVNYARGYQKNNPYSNTYNP
ncbi:hypothetical protein L195_g060936, partial [Trifolium pratense]